MRAEWACDEFSGAGLTAAGLSARPSRFSSGSCGTYGPDEHPRQLWWCRPVDGDKPHRFAELLPRALRRTAGHVCADCETMPAVFEGPQHPRNYEMPSRVIAAALMAVGTGDSYANASRTARVSARRSKA